MWWGEEGRGAHMCGVWPLASWRQCSEVTPAQCQLCPGTLGVEMWSVWTRQRHALSGPRPGAWHVTSWYIMHHLQSTIIFICLSVIRVSTKNIKYKLYWSLNKYWAHNSRCLGHQLPDDCLMKGPGLLSCWDDLVSWQQEAARKFTFVRHSSAYDFHSNTHGVQCPSAPCWWWSQYPPPHGPSQWSSHWQCTAYRGYSQPYQLTNFKKECQSLTLPHMSCHGHWRGHQLPSGPRWASPGSHQAGHWCSPRAGEPAGCSCGYCCRRSSHSEKQFGIAWWFVQNNPLLTCLWRM